MQKRLRYKILGRFKKGQTVFFRQFYKIFNEETGHSVVTFYNFLNECYALGLVESPKKGMYRILENKEPENARR